MQILKLSLAADFKSLVIKQAKFLLDLISFN